MDITDIKIGRHQLPDSARELARANRQYQHLFESIEQRRRYFSIALVVFGVVYFILTILFFELDLVSLSGLKIGAFFSVLMFYIFWKVIEDELKIPYVIFNSSLALLIPALMDSLAVGLIVFACGYVSVLARDFFLEKPKKMLVPIKWRLETVEEEISQIELYFTQRRKMLSKNQIEFDVDDKCRWLFRFTLERPEKSGRLTKYLEKLGYDVEVEMPEKDVKGNTSRGSVTAAKEVVHSEDSLLAEIHGFQRLGGEFGASFEDDYSVGAIESE